MSAGVILVTGGSRGIGAEVCRQAAAAGHDVAVNFASDAAAAEAVAAEVRAAGRHAMTIKANVADEADIITMFDVVASTLGPLTAFVNNAGVTGKSGRLEAADAAVIRTCIDINVTGAILAAREAVRRMSTRLGGKGGAIVNISSIAAGLGSPGEYVWYAASKGAIDSLTVGLAKEVAMDGIRVNAVSPGMVMTDIHEKSSLDVGRIERIRPNIPMQRIGEPREIAAAVMWLLSDAASYVTGSNLVVGGGR
jgi:NAD(P)-dependent dehydrogenase (short-subunit alcohol dehydrogenase family)